MTRKNMKNTVKKYSFSLKGVNTEKVDQRFGIAIFSNITASIQEKIPTNATKISDLSTTKNTPEIVSFLDEAKKSHKCAVSMIDYDTKKEFISNSIYDCFWCKNKIPVNVTAIGCPIKYIPSQVIKTYYSEISKDNYTIKENITSDRMNQLIKSGDDRPTIIDKNYYLTDGIFCSFNCCMSYISDNKTKSFYSMSEMLLLKMYNDINPLSISYIEEAPNWRKLLQFGGDLSIEQFRNSFGKIEYKEHGTVSKVPKFVSIGVLYEEKLKF